MKKSTVRPMKPCPHCNGTGEVPVTVGDAIMQLRTDKGITQEVLSKAVGISRAQIANLESGRGDASIDLMWKLADYFDVSVDQIIGRIAT